MGKNSSLRTQRHYLFSSEIRYCICIQYMTIILWDNLCSVYVHRALGNDISSPDQGIPWCSDPEEVQGDRRAVEPCGAFPGALRPKHPQPLQGSGNSRVYFHQDWELFQGAEIPTLGLRGHLEHNYHSEENGQGVFPNLGQEQGH